MLRVNSQSSDHLELGRATACFHRRHKGGDISSGCRLNLYKTLTDPQSLSAAGLQKPVCLPLLYSHYFFSFFQAEEKRSLFTAACNWHQKLFRDAMVGKGVDRHLFALYVVSKFLKMDSKFLKSVSGSIFLYSRALLNVTGCSSSSYQPPVSHPPSFDL